MAFVGNCCSSSLSCPSLIFRSRLVGAFIQCLEARAVASVGAQPTSVVHASWPASRHPSHVFHHRGGAYHRNSIDNYASLDCVNTLRNNYHFAFMQCNLIHQICKCDFGIFISTCGRTATLSLGPQHNGYTQDVPSPVQPRSKMRCIVECRPPETPRVLELCPGDVSIRG